MPCETSIIFGLYISIAFNCIFVLLAVVSPWILRKYGECFGFEQEPSVGDVEDQPGTYQCKDCKKSVSAEDQPPVQETITEPPATLPRREARKPPATLPLLHNTRQPKDVFFSTEVNKNLSTPNSNLLTPAKTPDGYVHMEGKSPNSTGYVPMDGKSPNPNGYLPMLAAPVLPVQKEQYL
jgi:hypothetical protein